MVRTIAELPFREGDALDVLRLDREDPDFTGTGYCRLGSLWLESREGEEPLRVTQALVMALHSPEEPEPLEGDVELEFWDEGVTVLLSRFLAVWLPRLVGGDTPRRAADAVDDRCVVLALCNPLRARVALPPGLGDRPLHYGLGDVESWLDEDELGPSVRLVADAWRLAQ